MEIRKSWFYLKKVPVSFSRCFGVVVFFERGNRNDSDRIRCTLLGVTWNLATVIRLWYYLACRVLLRRHIYKNETIRRKMEFGPTKSLKILVVEDDTVSRTLLQRLLSELSLPISKVKSAESLGAAFRLLNEDHFDVVLLDLNLPDSEGLDTLVRIREKHHRAAIIVITGEYSEEIGPKTIAMGAQEYLVKGSYDVETLSKSINYAIERNRTEVALRDERNKAQKYLDVAEVIMLVIDNKQKVGLVNRKGCEILGYNKEEIIGKDWCNNFVPEKARDEVRRIISGLLNGQVKQFEYYENPVLTSGGAERIIAWHNSILPDEKGQIEGMLSSGGDITEHKRAEETTRLAYEKLEKAHQELKGMQSQLVQSEKLASIGQLAAGVAHEMNTPVGFVASNFHTLETYVKKFKKLLEMYEELAREIETSEKTELLNKVGAIGQTYDDIKMDFILEDIQGLFDDSKEGLDRVTNIIQNLRDFSRIDQPGSLDEYNLNDGIEATLVVARNEIKYDADIKMELSEIPLVLCSAGQINQVFLNILLNAVQAIKSQEGDDRGTITIRTYSTETEVVCEICDDGPGIAAETLSKVFDPFFTTKPSGKGTGLGLTVSYDIIVTKHKGALLTDSTVGEGTKFTIKLPINRENVDYEQEIENCGKEKSIVC